MHLVNDITLANFKKVLNVVAHYTHICRLTCIWTERDEVFLNVYKLIS